MGAPPLLLATLPEMLVLQHAMTRRIPLTVPVGMFPPCHQTNHAVVASDRQGHHVAAVQLLHRHVPSRHTRSPAHVPANLTVPTVLEPVIAAAFRAWERHAAITPRTFARNVLVLVRQEPRTPPQRRQLN